MFNSLFTAIHHWSHWLTSYLHTFNSSFLTLQLYIAGSRRHYAGAQTEVSMSHLVCSPSIDCWWVHYEYEIDCTFIFNNNIAGQCWLHSQNTSMGNMPLSHFHTFSLWTPLQFYSLHHWYSSPYIKCSLYFRTLMAIFLDQSTLFAFAGKHLSTHHIFKVNIHQLL